MRPPHLIAALASAALLLSVSPTIAAGISSADNTAGILGGKQFPQLTLALHHHDSPHPCRASSSSHGTNHGDSCATNSILSDSSLDRLRSALQVMQTSWFEVWVGNWPTAIDWTRAVVDTHLIAAIGTVSKALLDISQRAGNHDATTQHDQREIENEINAYFSQNIAYYFGENAFRIRNEAYDDILWVVLGWLESVKFIHSHSRMHYSADNTRWHGHQFVDAFAHRARVFYDLASRGWDARLCGGGMLWSPGLAPYKNAITNELFISASVGMYLYFPGDDNHSPFVAQGHTSRPYEERHLSNAIEGYDWLNKSGMTNGKGLYTDGFHISNVRRNGTKCDIRDEMVYTYNQGVLLSGLRGLWEGTADQAYLEDGHQLVRNVIHATGWTEDASEEMDHDKWAGLGRGGVLEEACDAAGRCSQDAQTFKGIFFHHFQQFCEQLPLQPVTPGKTYGADRDLAALHRQSCRGYAPWVEHNAKAALATRNEKGQFGMWWGARNGDVAAAPLPDAAVDYRNNITEILDPVWAPQGGFSWSEVVRLQDQSKDRSAMAIDESANLTAMESQQVLKRDLNDRGRGRTVETHAGGVAVLRCLWELSNV